MACRVIRHVLKECTIDWNVQAVELCTTAETRKDSTIKMTSPNEFHPRIFHIGSPGGRFYSLGAAPLLSFFHSSDSRFPKRGQTCLAGGTHELRLTASQLRAGILLPAGPGGGGWPMEPAAMTPVADVRTCSTAPSCVVSECSHLSVSALAIYHSLRGNAGMSEAKCV